jgi:signal peptidase I
MANTEQAPPRPYKKSVAREYLESIVVAVILALFIRTFAVQAFKIPTGSMEPNLMIGDHLLVNKLVYSPSFGPLENTLFGKRPIERGHVVVFKYPEDAQRDFIKRVIGLPGEWIGGRNGSVWICRQEPPRRGPPGAGCRALDEPYIQGPQERFRFRQVPSGRYFVMGDNRDNSEDSRIIGTVPERAVIGRAVVRYWPPQRIGGLD